MNGNQESLSAIGRRNRLTRPDLNFRITALMPCRGLTRLKASRTRELTAEIPHYPSSAAK
jgi:hypothetical protein